LWFLTRKDSYVVRTWPVLNHLREVALEILKL
jgi:hypothetical protein